ncbi:MAG: DegT/DnrJ/EryC1/StrS family aminotransferase [Candidatus Brockarchaeota archaeon]|nr:DegT/DnrJ/EryC1/StrS family aminotransferase [Candidatus Brockarchaeota archaeon]
MSGMIDAKRRKQILARQRSTIYSQGEPYLGAYYTDEEIKAVVDTIRASMDPSIGFIGSLRGKYVEGNPLEKFEREFADFCGTKHCIAINGAGTGLDMAMMALDLEPGDEVIVPAINFRAAPLAVIGQGGKVVWCEVDERTFQADPADVERRITPRTRAIFPVHMNGLSAPMDELLDIAERHPHPKHGPLKVIGDAARACGGKYRGTRIGKKGWMTVFSFHSMKNMTTLGEGGAITTDDDELAERLKDIRQFGATTGRRWGTNYKMTTVQAAVGSVQLRRLDEMIERRRRIAHERNKLLEGVPELTLPYEPPDCWHTFYLYTCLVPEGWAGEKRDKLVKIMGEDYGVGCVVANPPQYREVPLLGQLTVGQDLPRSNKLGERLFCLSIHPLMTTEDNEYVCAALIETVERIREGSA